MASHARHSHLLRPLEPAFRRIEPAWNSVMEWMGSREGLPAGINGDVFRLTYTYGARYDKQREYEPDIYLPFAASIKAGMTVFDVGAHVGFFSLAAAQRVGPGGRVMAFEPSPETLRVLRDHVRLNGWDDRVTVEASVVSDQAGSMTFYTFGESMAASLSRENVEELNVEQPDHATPLTVPSVTLDQYCEEWTLSPDVIKIDVEGAELKVLRGAEKLLRSKAVTIWCEVHPMQMANLGDSVEALGEYLAGVGYVAEPIAAPGHMGIYQSHIHRVK